jgi:hypothetical protein
MSSAAQHPALVCGAGHRSAGHSRLLQATSLHRRHGDSNFRVRMHRFGIKEDDVRDSLMTELANRGFSSQPRMADVPSIPRQKGGCQRGSVPSSVASIVSRRALEERQAGVPFVQLVAIPPHITHCTFVGVVGSLKNDAGVATQAAVWLKKSPHSWPSTFTNWWACDDDRRDGICDGLM